MNRDKSEPESAIHASIDDMLREIGASPRRPAVEEDTGLFESLLKGIEEGSERSSQDRSAALDAASLGLAPMPSRARRFLVFEVGEEVLAIPSNSLREVVDCPPVTPVPWGASWLQGITNRRGEVLAVVDLSALFQAPPRRKGRARLAVVGTQTGSGTGLLADRVLGMRSRVDDELFESSELESAIFSPHASGFFLEADRQVPILDVDALLSFLAIRQRASSGGSIGID